MLLRHFAENALNRLAGGFFPAVLLCVSAVALHSYLEQAETPRGAELSLRALERSGDAADQRTRIAAEVQRSPASTSVSTALSTRPFWLALSANAPQANAPWAIEFPSRHAMQMECWDRDTDARLGRATRGEEDGLLERSRGGFALNLPAGQRATACSARPASVGRPS